MGEREQILLAEGDTDLRGLMNQRLEREGHKIVAATGSLDELRQFVDNPELLFRVAIVSGYLPDRGDGEKAAEYIRNKRPGSVVISFSANMQTFGDYNIRKQQSSGALLEVLQKI